MTPSAPTNEHEIAKNTLRPTDSSRCGAYTSLANGQPGNHLCSLDKGHEGLHKCDVCNISWLDPAVKPLRGNAPSEGQRLAIARLVALSWRDAAMRWGDLQMDGQVAAHPLACVMSALDGESDPIELGISPTDDVWSEIVAINKAGGR